MLCYSLVLLCFCFFLLCDLFFFSFSLFLLCVLFFFSFALFLFYFLLCVLFFWPTERKDFFCWSVFCPSVLLWHTARTETHSQPTYVTCTRFNTQTRTLLCRMWLKGQAPYRLWHGRRKEGCEQSVCDSGGAGRRDSGLRSRRHDTLLVSPLPMSAQRTLKDSREKQRRRGRDIRGGPPRLSHQTGSIAWWGVFRGRLVTGSPLHVHKNTLKSSAVVHVS